MLNTKKLALLAAVAAFVSVAAEQDRRLIPFGTRMRGTGTERAGDHQCDGDGAARVPD